MNFYLAAQYGRRGELCRYREDLRARGHAVTSRWLDGAHQIGPDGAILGEDGETRFENGSNEAAVTRVKFARHDLDDVRDAQVFLAFTEDPALAPAPGTARGGRHVELGWALGLQAMDRRRRIRVIGPRENLFCWLPGIEHYASWAHFLTWLDADAALGIQDPEAAS
jgi:hypothetical protein